MQSLIGFLQLAVLFSSLLVNALPVPTNPGDIVAVKPSDYDNPGTKPKTLRHQSVLLTGPDADSKHTVAQTSSNLPTDRYPHQDDANKYHTDFPEGHKINVGTPDKISADKIQASGKITTPMEASKLKELKDKIDANCNAGLTWRDGKSCKYTPKKAATSGQKKKAPKKNGQSHKAPNTKKK